MTLNSKIFNALVVEGAELTAKQMAARFGTSVQSVISRVSELRLNKGIAVYRNKHTDSNNRTVFKYRVGSPTRAVVAAGFKATLAS
jgi:hypothetical protein